MSLDGDFVTWSYFVYGIFYVIVMGGVWVVEVINTVGYGMSILLAWFLVYCMPEDLGVIVDGVKRYCAEIFEGLETVTRF